MQQPGTRMGEVLVLDEHDGQIVLSGDGRDQAVLARDGAVFCFQLREQRLPLDDRAFVEA